MIFEEKKEEKIWREMCAEKIKVYDDLKLLFSSGVCTGDQDRLDSGKERFKKGE